MYRRDAVDGEVLPTETLSVIVVAAGITLGEEIRYPPVGNGVGVGVGVIVGVGVGVGVLVGVGVGDPFGSGVAMGVGVVATHRAAAPKTAPAALAIEPVESLAASGVLFTPLARIVALSCAIVSLGHAECASAASPVTCGAAMEVPEREPYVPFRRVL